MDKKKDLTDAALEDEASEIRGRIADCMAQLYTLEGVIKQAESDKREARIEYDKVLNAGQKQLMDAAIAKIAAATAILRAGPTGVEDIQLRINEFQSRQKELITEARRQKAEIEAVVAAGTRQVAAAEGVIGNVATLAMEIGKLSEKLRDLVNRKKRNKKDDENEKNNF